jgi:hypothetical protein
LHRPAVAPYLDRRRARRVLSVLQLSAVAAGSVVVAPGSPALAVRLPVGAQSLDAVIHPGRYVRHQDSLGRPDPASSTGTAEAKLAATVRMTGG